MAGRRGLSPEDERLWRRVAATARAYSPMTPLPQPEADPQPAPMANHLPKTRIARRHLQDFANEGVGARAKPAPTLPSTPAATAPDASSHRKVRRGKLDIEARIDLHGMRQPEAETALAGFLARCRSAGMRCVLVVTGKGRPVDPGEDFITPQAGVIRRRLPEWLAGPHLRPHVAGVAAAHPRHGGAGASYVLLKARV